MKEVAPLTNGIPQGPTYANTAPTVVLLDELLKRAIQFHASDIHLEPAPEILQVRFRIDGLLSVQSPIEKSVGTHLIARIKVLASLNVAECRLPQDGKLSVTFFDRQFDIRIATFPSVHGEKVVLRILERSYKSHLLEELGFDETTYTAFKKIAQSAQGFFLVTGPTGSGKTTTLHALLSSINSPEKNLTTLEDPVEYIIEGVTQTQISPERGFTFEQGIRSLLRADPDIIMVGEIRDKQTAHVALQAALTGHFVVSTLHTNDAVSALLRLLDMSIEPFLIRAGLTAVVAQRLVRKLCKGCRYTVEPSAEEQELLKTMSIDCDLLSKSRGCPDCLNTGYAGRIGIFQLLVLSDKIRTMLTKQPDYRFMYEAALYEGMRPLTMAASDKIRAGITSLAEVMRVLG